MKLFLDSADLAEIKEFSKWRIIDGITTTPTFFKRLNVNDSGAAIREISSGFKGEIHVEALGQSVDDIVAAARNNRAMGENIVSKIPIGPMGLEAACILEEEGLPVNLHLVFSVNQAILAAKAGATYICPLMGRLNDAGLNGAESVSEIIEAVDLYPEFNTTVMVSSIRNAEDVRRSFLMGARAVTIPGKIFKRLFDSPLTDKAHTILAMDTLRAEPVSTRMKGLEQLPVLAPSADAHAVMVEMTLKKMGIVVVVEQGKMVGVITDGDLRRNIKNHPDSRDLLAQEIMNRAPMSVAPDDPLGKAVEIMRTRRTNQVLVVGSANEPLGFVNLHDLMNPPEER